MILYDINHLPIQKFLVFKMFIVLSVILSTNTYLSNQACHLYSLISIYLPGLKVEKCN